MAHSFDKFVRDLQETVIQDARVHYTGKVVDLWLNPRNLGVLDHPQAHATIKGPCGDTMEIFLHINGDRITKATFTTDGCGPTVAAGSMATQLAAGKSLHDAAEITQNVILKALGGLPDESKHCALLAATTLSTAMAEYVSPRALRKPDAGAVDEEGKGMRPGLANRVRGCSRR